MTERSTEPVLAEEPALNITWSRLAFFAILAIVVAYCGVLLAAMGVQIFGNEKPCPLCMLQRYAMILATIPAMWIVADALRGQLTRSRYAAGLGMSIVAAVAGSFESTRQILLHIASTTDPGYGSAVMGLHLYTWALITFVIVIAFCGVALMCCGSVVPVAPGPGALRTTSRVVEIGFLVVIALNVVSIVLLEGFNWVLPDDPIHYQLINDLGFGLH
jgi:disulfide bond formation protein DsbB